jgi:hypothetical protein
MKGRLKSNAQTDRCQMRGHGAREAGVRLEDVSPVDLFFGTPAFYETSPGHSRAASDVGTGSSDENHG